MTKEQKAFILSSHEAGKTYAEIATALKMSPHTVKSVFIRNRAKPTHKTREAKPVQERSENCKQCGRPLNHTPHHKAKSFCSDKCRLDWWHAHRHLAQGAEQHICPVCGANFAAIATRKYCSHSCYIRARYGPTGPLEESNDRGTVRA